MGVRRVLARNERPYPVADGFFRPMALSERRLRELREQAAKALEMALLEREGYHKSRVTFLTNSPTWRLHTQYQGLSEYTRPHRTRPEIRASRVFGAVQGEYRDLAEFFQSETRVDYFNVQKKLFSQTVDAEVLYNVPHLPIREVNAPLVKYEGVKWAAYRPRWLLMRLDTCYFESTGTGVDSNGKPYAFRIVIPAVFDQVPDLFRTKRTVRVECKSVMIVSPLENESESSELFMTLQNDFKGNYIPRCIHRRMLKTLHHLPLLADDSYVWKSNQWVLGNRPSCGVCARPFTLVRVKHTCTVCSEGICHKCIDKGSRGLVAAWTRQLAKVMATPKVCGPCGKRVRDEPDGTFDTPMLGDSSASHVQRMSEPAMQASRILKSYIASSSCSTASSISSGWRSLLGAWIPVLSSKAQLGMDQTTLTNSSSSASSPGADLDSPVFAHMNGLFDQVANLETVDLIFEEDHEISSQRSAADYITIDTSDMERVRTDSGNSSSRSLPTGVEAFEVIRTSLQEQEMLLRQLQHATGSFPSQRSTDGARSNASSFFDTI